MKKADFIKQLSERLGKEAIELPLIAVDKVLGIIFDSIGNVIKKGDSILIPGFGTFKQTKRSARKGRNPQTGEEIKIKARKVPQFKASTALKEKVK